VLAAAFTRCGHPAAGLMPGAALGGTDPLDRAAPSACPPAAPWSDDFQEAGSTPATPLTDALHRIEREARPPMRCAGHRGRPPQLLGKWPLADYATLRASRTWRCNARGAAMPHSERCCGIPAKRARTSVSRYRRCPPSVRIDVSFPAFAHLVTVFGSTLNIVATSAGVSSGSASGVRADMLTASPPGPVLRSLLLLAVRGSLVEPASDVPYGPLRPYCHHQR
jgi:hypothetical protein